MTIHSLRPLFISLLLLAGPAAAETLQFESFQSPMDRELLVQYIDARSKAQSVALRRAA